MTAPKLRLAGFKGPWSPKRLGETGHILQERTSDFARYPLYSLTIEKGVTKKTERYERGFLVSKTGDIFKIVHPGNFVTNPMNLRFGAVGYSKEKDDVSVSGYYDVFELDDNKCSPFWFNFLKREEMKKRYEDIATGSLIEKKRVHVNDLLNLELPIPELEERKSLGEYLTSLDRLIDAEALRLESLRKFKTASLEKMFVHDGEKCPRLRLGGFRGDWERICLGDIGVYSGGKGYSKSSLKSTGKPIVLYGRLYTQYETTIKDVKTFADLLPNSVLSDGGEVVVPTSGEEAADIAVAAVIKNPEVIIGGGLTVITLNKRYDSVFVALVITYGSTHHALAKVAQGKTIVHLYADELKKVSAYVPPTLEEQQAIGEFFAEVDRAMQLSTNRLEKFGHLKSACMERMFV